MKTYRIARIYDHANDELLEEFFDTLEEAVEAAKEMFLKSSGSKYQVLLVEGVVQRTTIFQPSSTQNPS